MALWTLFAGPQVLRPLYPAGARPAGDVPATAPDKAPASTPASVPKAEGSTREYAITTEPGEDGPVRIERGDGEVPLILPRGEELVFDVIIDLGILGDVDVGDVTLSSGLERTPRGLPSSRDAQRKVEMFDRAWIKSVAQGGYAGYEVTQTITANHLSQDWPRILYKDQQRGSENRERELKIGLRDGHTTAEYRNDHHCQGCSDKTHFVDSVWAWGKPSHCKKCKLAEHRVWKEPGHREVPKQSIDMLSAVYVARAMVELGVKETSFPLVDKQRVWRVKVQQGGRERHKVPAGTFECAQMQLITSLEPGEKPDGDSKNFQGLFGIQGTIRIFFDAKTGVPVLIQGQLPIPVPFVGDLDLSVQLKSYKGTPKGFGPKR